MNILITGIHGFVGSNLVMSLKEHHVLYGLDIIAPEKEGVEKTFSWKDIESTAFPMQRLPQFVPSFIWPVKPMIQRINPLHRRILISIRD